MAESTARKHTIDILFPWALFGLLAICGLLVLILAADIYQDTTTMADENYESRTVLSYLTEKIHQNDNGTVTIGSVDGTDSLIIRQDYDGEEYCTYIFEEDGMLKELFVRSGTAVSTADGKAVIPVEDFKMEALENGLLHFSCMSEDGRKMDTVVAVVGRRQEKRKAYDRRAGKTFRGIFTGTYDIDFIFLYCCSGGIAAICKIPLHQ